MPAVGTTHHLKLGTEFLIVRPNSYNKKPAPTFGARITTGDPDYNNLSIWQHWVQKCWIGGMGADAWVDDAMFKTSIGVDTTVHEKATIGRALIQTGGTGWTLGGSTNMNLTKFIVFANVLYALHQSDPGTDSRLYSYNTGTTSWTEVALPGTIFIARSIQTFDGRLFVGGSEGTPKVYWATAPGTWTVVANPAGLVGSTPYAMKQYNGKLYVAFTTEIWRLKSDLTWDGSTVFYKVNANSGSNYVQTMETHLGFLYFLSQNGHLHRTDGNNTFDIWSWDGQTAGVSLRSYDGKLFVGTYEYTDDVNIGYGVLYQFTGAAVTELKRWGVAGKSTTIGQMIAYSRKLYYGASGLFGLTGGFGVAVYDSIEDAHSIYAIQLDTTTYPDTSGTGKDWIVDDVIIWGGKLFCAVRKHGVFRTPSSFQDADAGLALYTPTSPGGVLTSSLYDAGTPGLQKLWRKITVYCDLPVANTSYVFSYSIDGGTTYTALPSQVGPTASGAQQVFYLNNIRSTRFLWKITMYTTDQTKSPILRGVVVAYLPQPEPNWMWTMTIPVADKWTLLDGSVEVKNTNTLIAYLEGLFRSQTLVSFTDPEGTVWAANGPGVLVYDMQTVHYDIEQPRESDIRLTLLETVETY